MHGDLENETVLKALDLESVENRGKVIGIELDLLNEDEGRISSGGGGEGRNQVERTSTTAPMTVFTLPTAWLASVA